MALVSELHPGTRCLVDVAAMERDGPNEELRCTCWTDIALASFRRYLRTLAERVLVVTNFVMPKKPHLRCFRCGARIIDPFGDYVDTEEEGLIRAKYLLPLPEQGGERRA